MSGQDANSCFVDGEATVPFVAASGKAFGEPYSPSSLCTIICHRVSGSYLPLFNYAITYNCLSSIIMGSLRNSSSLIDNFCDSRRSSSRGCYWQLYQDRKSVV